MARPVVKWAAEPPSAAADPVLSRARLCRGQYRTKGRGPSDHPGGSLHRQHRPSRPATFSVPRQPACPPALAQRPSQLLRAAERPVVIAGSGVWWSRAEDALRRFIEHTSLPLYTITMARGTVPDDHPLSMGYADPALNHAVHTAFREADLFLVIGKRIDYRLALGGARLFPPAARFIQIDIHPEELGLNRPLDVAICADARLALMRSPRPPVPSRGPPGPGSIACARLRRDWEARLAAAASDAAAPMHPAAFFRELSAALPARRPVLLGWRRFRALGPRHAARARARRLAAAGAARHHRLRPAQQSRPAARAPRQARRG